ncbi:MAG: winged helix-turn-helix domain-containing protein [Muribaculaceae bacterium]|nr:winged helix-turn-helix domain-containing protein [Muribaculaceae bacterium]
MTIETIGTWAGEVYKALEVSDTRMLGLKLIKKATKLKKDEIMAALGWLGREGKIVITMNDEDIVVALV